MAIVGRTQIKDFDNLMAKFYRKKPVTITAIQMDKPFEIQTLEGIMQGEVGDYLIKGIRGELYPCKKETFRDSYEEIK